MSFRGKVVDVKEIDSPFGKISIEEREFYPYPKRRKVIWWMGELSVAELGTLITVYHVDPSRKSDHEPIKWVPLYYRVELNEEADLDEAGDMFFAEEDEDGYDFDDLDKAMKFIEMVKCKSLSGGGIQVDSKAEFKRWETALDIFRERQSVESTMSSRETVKGNPDKPPCGEELSEVRDSSDTGAKGTHSLGEKSP